MSRPRLLDAFFNIGGSGMGYRRAGFDVTGVDLEVKDCPFEVIQGDAVEFIREHGHEFDAVLASPPCQSFSTITPDHARGGYPDLIGATRKALIATGKPWVIENVPAAEKKAPMRRDLMLCGEMFSLRVLKHRIFEASFLIEQPKHRPHRGRVKGSGRRSRGTYTTEGYYCGVYGEGGDRGTMEEWQEAMGIDWTRDRHELAEAIPPAFAEYIGAFMKESL